MNCVFRGKFTVLFLAFTASRALYAVDSDWLNDKLQEFDSDPKKFISDPANVRKYDPATSKPLQDLSVFSEEDIASGDYILQKENEDPFTARVRARIRGKAHIAANDQPVNLVDELKYQNLIEMEQAGLTRGALSETPWSDDYWPIYLGAAAMRYADPRFPWAADWQSNRNYVFRTQSSVDLLSPAEKYDLLVGDRKLTLTQAMFADGAGYYQKTGKVERWMGLCHGWAAASYMLPRPTRKITLLAADGRTPINFYPSDIKALATLLYAKAAPKSRFIGGRCNQKNPATDAMGRVIAPDCFDTNPGTWHLSVVNQIGHSKRSFIMDSTYDYEVWNQPIYSYEYVYFNPKIRKYVKTLQEAIVPFSEYRNDPFARYRSPRAEYSVGVAMKLVYVAEVRADHRATDSPRYDRLVAVNYLYDLELDKGFNILGGEWYQQRHPDFLWTPGPESKAISVGDQYLRRPDYANSKWDGSTSIPAKWTPIAQYSSQRGQPLATVVDTLIQLSQLGM